MTGSARLLRRGLFVLLTAGVLAVPATAQTKRPDALRITLDEARQAAANALMAAAAGAAGFDVLDSVASSTGGLAATACSAARCALTVASVAGNVTAAGALAHRACDCIARTDLHLPVRRFTRVNANGDW